MSIVVPITPTHDRYLPSLIANLSSSTCSIESVIIARSELRDSERSRYQDHLDRVSTENSIKFPIILSSIQKKQLAGANRNRGWSEVKSAWTSFCDADDWYSPFRLNRMVDVARQTKSNLVCHNYFLNEPTLTKQTEEEGRLLAPVPSDLIFEHTFPRGSRDRELEGSSSGDTNLVVPSDSGKFWPVHHAHLLVNNSVRGQIGFGELPRGEDGQFCRDVLWELGGVTYIPLKLSAYMSTRSTANSHSYSSCARAGLYKLKSKITFPKNSNRPY